MDDPITLCCGPLSATFLPLGARLTGLWHAGFPDSLVLGYRAPEAYATDPFYLGAVVGPIANRVAGSIAEVGGTRWQMTPNEGDTCLHSGPDGASQKQWRTVAQSGDHAAFELEYAHGEGGLPGNRHLCIDYRLTSDALALSITATSDKDTPINLAHHPYWCLDALPEGTAQWLSVTAETYLPVNARGLPTGDILSVKDSSYDFTQPRLVPTDTPLDANLCLSPHRSMTPTKVARLAARNGLAMTLETTEPGMQVYNGAGLYDTGDDLHTGHRLRPYMGLALEPQGWPDALNHTGFPTIMLKAGSPTVKRRPTGLLCLLILLSRLPAVCSKHVLIWRGIPLFDHGMVGAAADSGCTFRPVRTGKGTSTWPRKKHPPRTRRRAKRSQNQPQNHKRFSPTTPAFNLKRWIVPPHAASVWPCPDL